MPGKVPRGSFHVLHRNGFTGLGRLVLDKLDRGVLLIDERGRVLDANASGQRVLKAGEGIALRSGRFTFVDAALDERLSKMFRRNGLAAVDGTQVIAARVRRSRGAPFHVVVSSVPPDADERDVAFVALIYAPRQQHEISTAVLRELYSLTPAQADIARHLFAGHSVEATADALELSLNTVRTHLKHIFAKCEVRSQAELQHLLALGPHEL